MTYKVAKHYILYMVTKGSMTPHISNIFETVTRNYISKYRYPNNRDIHDMAELSLEGLFGIGEAIGIIATLFVILYFSRKQMQSLSVDIQTKVLNDLDEKRFARWQKSTIEKPSMQKVSI